MTKRFTSTGMWLEEKPEKTCQEKLERVLRDNEALASSVDDLRELREELEASLAAASAAEVDAVQRAQELQRDHAVTLERIANLAVEAALTDGAHHKQWYLEKIMAECGAPMQRWHKAH